MFELFFTSATKNFKPLILYFFFRNIPGILDLFTGKCMFKKRSHMGQGQHSYLESMILLFLT